MATAPTSPAPTVWVFTDTESAPVAERLVHDLQDEGASVELMAPERSAKLALSVEHTEIAIHEEAGHLALPGCAVILGGPLTPLRGLHMAMEFAGVAMLNPAIATDADERAHQLLTAAWCGLATLPSLHTADREVVIGDWPGNDLLAERSFLHRVVVVGDQLYGARTSGDTGGVPVTLPVVLSPSSATESELPTWVEEACKRLVRAVGAKVASVDLVESQGRYVFLDLNCCGHYLDVEQLTNAPICREIARLACRCARAVADGGTSTSRLGPV